MSAELPRSTCDTPQWQRLRNQLLNRLKHDEEAGRVDSDILDVLHAINRYDLYVTSSSCSGRIAVFAAPTPEDKKRGGIVRSWHRPVTVDELKEALYEALSTSHSFVWVASQPPILALHTCSLTAANCVANMFAQNGFKYTGYRYLPARRAYYMTVRGLARIDIPIRVAGQDVINIDDDTVERLVFALNTYLTKAKYSLDRIRKAVREALAECPKRGDEATLLRRPLDSAGYPG
jgi:tRNA wybutosine-synthesizing protein 3